MSPRVVVKEIMKAIDDVIFHVVKLVMYIL